MNHRFILMNKMIIKEELKWLMEAINEQFEAIRTYDDKIPQIEFDILMDNIRKFYDDLLRLKYIQEKHLIPDQKAATPQESSADAKASLGSPVDPVKSSAGERSFVSVSTRSSAAPPEKIAGIGVAEPPVEPVYTATSGVAVKEDTIPPRQPDLTPPVTVPEQETEGSPPTIRVRFDKPAAPKEHTPPAKKHQHSRDMDLFASEEPSFSIKLQEAREKSLGPKGSSNRIENLKNAININEKFMFINDLFDGNLREYNETIETLNGFKSLEQAGDFLDLMRRKNFWDTGSPAFKRLKELLERKF